MGVALAACRRIAGSSRAGSARSADNLRLPDRQFPVGPQSTRAGRCGLTAMRRDALRQKLFTRRAGILAGGQALLLAAIGGRVLQRPDVWSPRPSALSHAEPPPPPPG